MSKSETEEESSSPTPSDKKKISSRVTFIGAYILALLILLVIELLTYKEDSEKSSYFLVIVHNISENHLELQSLKRLQETLQKYDQAGVSWSLLIPKTKVPLQHDDGDTFYDVQRVSDDEQIIRLSYELGIGNHPSIKYRAKNNTAEPLFTFSFGNYFLAIFLALLIIVVIEIVKFMFQTIIWIKRKIDHQES